jgi:hypothetical protein
VLLTILLAACQQQQRAENLDPRLAPVTELNAPTFGGLAKKGYVIVDSVDGSFVCGDDCITETFEHVFLGLEKGPDDKSPPEYACPGVEKDMDDWKCRPLNLKVSNG